MRSTWTGFKGGVEVIGLKVRDAPSGLAVLIKVEKIDDETLDEAKDKWIPYSQIEAGSFNPNTQEYKCIVSDWFGRKLIEELQ